MTDYSYSDVVSIKDLVIMGDKGNSLIWKKGWFFDDLITVDLQELTADDSKKGILGAIHMDGNDGFFEKTNELHQYFYFLPDKNAEPEYVPFDLDKKEDRNALRGKWVKSKDPDYFYEYQITKFDRSDDEIFINFNVRRSSGTGLLEDFVFLDGTPVGKLANS